jgi:regulator of replication initiation timing
VNHLKSRFNKFQILAIIFTTVTVIAVILSSISGFQLGKLIRSERQSDASKTDSIQSTLKNELEAATKEVQTLREKLEKSSNVNQSLKKKNASLQQKLQETLQPPASPLDDVENDSKPENLDEPSEQEAQTPAPEPIEAEAPQTPAPDQASPPSPTTEQSQPTQPAEQSQSAQPAEQSPQIQPTAQPTEQIDQPDPAPENNENGQVENNTTQTD